MKIFWTLKSVPELQALPNDERKQIWRENYLKLFRHWQTWAAIVLFPFCIRGTVLLGEMVLGVSPGSRPSGLLAGFGAIVGLFLITQVMISVIRPYLRKEQGMPDS